MNIPNSTISNCYDSRILQHFIKPMEHIKDIIIVGAGLSGLTLAYQLTKQGKDITILEASERVGGRIQTINGPLNTPLELGATWFSDIHTHLLALLTELQIEKFPQYSGGISLFQTKSFEPAQGFYVPASDTPSYRIAGGTQVLIDTLCEKFPEETIQLNNQVKFIQKRQDHLLLETTTGSKYMASKVAICIPPQLAASGITFSPVLPDTIQALLPTVQTWMAGAIKFVVEYEHPFWREQGYSGMLYSHAGIITEMYDHTNYEANKYGFTGFLNGGAVAYTTAIRKELVLQQLASLFGPRANTASAYFDKIWADQYIITGTPVIQRPHQNNGHPLLQHAYFDQSLFFCGTETSSKDPGYMEGAVAAALKISHNLFNKTQAG